MDGINLYTRNIYLIGTAEKGPVNYPVQVTNINSVIRIFGTKGSLIDGASMVIDMQVPCNLWLCKTSGSHAEVGLNVLLENGEIIKGGFLIRSRHADDICNNIEVFLDDNFLSFKLNGYGDYEMSYDLSQFHTLKDLSDAINKDTRLLKNEIITVVNCPYDTPCKFTLSPVNDTFFKMKGGSSGLYYTKNELFFSMINTYSTLSGQFTDIIVPLCMYYDDSFTDDVDLLPYVNCNKDYVLVKDDNGEYESFYNQLLEFCVSQMQHGIVSHGVMDTEPRTKYKSIEDEFVKYMAAFKKINTPKNDMDKYSMMVSICANDLWDNYGTHITSGAVPYATIISSIDVVQSTTNKNFTDKFILVDKYSNSTLHNLSSQGFVCYRYSPIKHLPTVYSGVTPCSINNFRYIENVRTFQIVAKHFRTFLQQYIGMNIEDLVDSGVFEDSVKIMLDELISFGVIESVKFVNVTIKEYHSLVIDIDFVSIHTFETIRMSNGICLGDGGM